MMQAKKGDVTCGFDVKSHTVINGYVKWVLKFNRIEVFEPVEESPHWKS